jgi:hypothetical protein
MDNYYFDPVRLENVFLHRLKRKVQRLGVKIHKAMNPLDREQLSAAEQEAYSIFRRMVKDPDVELLTSPLSGKYYLKSESRGMLLILDRTQLSIVNHVFGYNVPLSTKCEMRMHEMFLLEVEKRRTEMEEEFTQNIKHSLKSIINRYDNKEQQS